LIASRFVMALVYMTWLLRHLTLPKLHEGAAKHIIFTCGIVGAATHAIIAVCTSFMLFKLKKYSVNDSTHRILVLLVLFTINTGLWPALVSLSIVVAFVALPRENLTFAALFYILSPVSCNAFLAGLTTRNFIRRYGQLDAVISNISDTDESGNGQSSFPMIFISKDPYSKSIA